MMDLEVPDLKDPCSLDSFRGKLKLFGLNGITSAEVYKRLKCYIKVRIHESIKNNAYQFCQEQFVDNWIWSNPINQDFAEIYFIYREDALMFKLRFTPLDTIE